MKTVQARFMRQLFSMLAIFSLSFGLTHCASTEEEEGYDDEFSNGNFNESSDNFAFNESEEGANANTAVNDGEFNNFEGENANNASEDEYAMNEYGEGEQVNNFDANEELSQDNLSNINNEGFNNLFNNQANQGIAGLDNEGFDGVQDDPLANNAVTVSNEILNAAVNGTDEGIDSELINAATVGEDEIEFFEGEGNSADSEKFIDTSATGGLIPASERGRVRYAIRRAGIYANPGNAAPVNHLERGDHPLFWDAGEFQKMSDGRVVYGRDLTDHSVGRDRKPGPWMSQGAGSGYGH